MRNFNDTRPLLIISGATASGKSAFALECAKAFCGEIISADSMQVYTGFDIGTAKITKDEQAQIKHHLIDILPPNGKYTTFDFKQDAEKIIADLHNENKLPIICGGTGLYINSILFNYDFNGSKEPNNKYKIVLIVLDLPRAELYEHINNRVDKMLSDGLIDEIKQLINSGISTNNSAFSSIGYKEFLPYLNGEKTLKECADILKQHSRNYAKRQLTWFRNQWPNKIVVNANNKGNIIDIIRKELNIYD